MPGLRPSAGEIRSITLRYYVVGASYSFGPFIIMAVYPLFLRSRGLDQLRRINVVSAVYVLVTFLTDVPTGAFADAVGRRIAVAVGCALHAVAFAVYFLSHNYWQFIGAACVDGLGTTFGNGPIDAWAIDALDRAGFEGPKDVLFSRRYQVAQIMGMAATLSGAYLAQVNIATPFLVNVVVWSTAGLIAVALMDSSTGRSRPMSQILSEIQRRSVDSTRLGFADRNLRWLATAGFLSALLWYGWGQEWQHYFNRGLRSGIGAVGWVSVSLIFAQIIGLEVAARLSRAHQHRAAIVAAGTGIATSSVIVAGIANAHMTVALFAIMVATFTLGVVGPGILAWFNEMIEAENRATLLSFGTTMATLGGMVGLPLQGKLVDAFGTGTAWQIAGVVAMFQVLCYLAVKPGRVAEAIAT
jgi:MFS transporter, DHA3 family, tetracycline resistance protein